MKPALSERVQVQESGSQRGSSGAQGARRGAVLKPVSGRREEFGSKLGRITHCSLRGKRPELSLNKQLSDSLLTYALFVTHA